MKAEDLFAGPIVRRAQQDMVAIWVATRKHLPLSFAIREAGSDTWLGKSTQVLSFDVFPKLHVYLGIVTSLQHGGKFPTGKLLEYSIAVLDFSNEEQPEDHSHFEEIVREDGLAYDGFRLPTFFLQGTSQALKVMYTSCRKIHGKGEDAMQFGDRYIARHAHNIAMRPAILALTGDQIYADDVPDEAFDEVTRIAEELTGGGREILPKGITLPGKGARQDFLSKKAGFTSGSARNHVMTLAEYCALYGLAWSKRNWSKIPESKDVKAYVDALPAARRLLANTPAYMCFDDHEITDDWFQYGRWRETAWERLIGRRIIANGLYAFWLFQAWGNDPDVHNQSLSFLLGLNATRVEDLRAFPNELDTFFWTYENWEFFTPTYPLVYFLDTRTQRGPRDGFAGTDHGPPAYLKTLRSWQRTVKRLSGLLARQSRDFPLVLVSPAPVFGFTALEDLQGVGGKVAPHGLDYELWSHNPKHLLLFLSIVADRNVLLLSGDVHFGYTTTVKFSNFDDEFLRIVARRFPGLQIPGKEKMTGSQPTYQYLYSSRLLQLTSSAAKNLHTWPFGAIAGLTSGHRYLIDHNGSIRDGYFKDGKIWVVLGSPDGSQAATELALEQFKPNCAFTQRFNDAANVRYIKGHNMGVVTIGSRRVENGFLWARDGKRRALRYWDYDDESHWE